MGVKRLCSIRGVGGAAVLTALMLLLPGLGRAPFDDPGEGMHAEIAREILLTGDWITLHLNGVRYFEKPPLLYWLSALGMRVSGSAELACRLWPMLGALAAVGATAVLGSRLGSARGGLMAGLALLTSVGFFAYSRYLRPETLFVASIQWGFALLLPAIGASRRPPLLGFAALGIAALAKDPLGALAPLAAVAVALSLAGRLRPLSAWLPWSGVGLLLAVGGAWYLLVELRNAGFLWYVLVDNHLWNFLGARHFPDEDVPLTSSEFLAVAGLGAFPWVLPAALTIVGLVARRAWREPRELPWIALAVWAVGIFVLFALAPFKLPHYGLPAYPALGLLAARWWEENRPTTRPIMALHLIAFAAVAVTGSWLYSGNGPHFLQRVFDAADVYTRKEVALGQVAPVPAWEELRTLIGWTAVAFGAGSLCLLAVVLRGARSLGRATIIVTLLAWLPLAGRAESLVAESRSVRELALEVNRRASPTDLLVHEGAIENSGALEFYAGRRPAILDGRVSVLGFGATFRDARDTFWDRTRMTEAWRSPRRIFLVTTRAPEHSAVRYLSTGEVHRLAAGGGRWLYSNRP